MTDYGYQDIYAEFVEETIYAEIVEETIEATIVEETIEATIVEETLLLEVTDTEEIQADLSAEEITVEVESWSCPQITSGTEGGEFFEAEIYTLSATDIANKFVQLTYIPADNSEIEMQVRNAPIQEYGTDFEQDKTFSKRITWEGLGLGNLLQESDKIKITYTRS